MKLTYSYIVVSPSDDVTKIRVPRAWNPTEVQDKFTHSLVFLFVPKGETAAVRNGKDWESAHGPAWLISKDGDWRFAAEPQNASHANKIYREAY